ncbi:hypothetical protein AB1N83_000447 [Pleurotus pulmonarius]
MARKWCRLRRGREKNSAGSAPEYECSELSNRARSADSKGAGILLAILGDTAVTHFIPQDHVSCRFLFPTVFHRQHSPHMRSSLLPLFLLPLFAYAQQQSGGGNSNNVQLSTTLITSVTLGPDRAESSVTITRVFTITPAATSAAPTATGNNPSGSASGSVRPSGSGNAPSATITTTPANLPTAQSIDAGQTHSAPIPGAKAGGGIYGPDDDYTAGALALRRSTVLMGAAGLVAGGAVMLL